MSSRDQLQFKSFLQDLVHSSQNEFFELNKALYFWYFNYELFPFSSNVILVQTNQICCPLR